MSYYKGELFENYVEEKLFPAEMYDLIRRTDTYERNKKRFAKSTLEPDRIFETKIDDKLDDQLTINNKPLVFGVECKYRSKLNNKGRLEWAKNIEQLNTYKMFDKSYPVFIIIGFGGTSDNPDKLYFFRVTNEKYIHIDINRLEKYFIRKEAITYKLLKEHLKDGESGNNV
jgi:flavodoxin